MGRGTGSGKGKTSGRGQCVSAQGASRRAGYEGGQMLIYRQVPKRGFTNARFRTDYTIINVGDLSASRRDVDLEAILSKVSRRRTRPPQDPRERRAERGHHRARAEVLEERRAKIEVTGGTVVELDARGRDASAES